MTPAIHCTNLQKRYKGRPPVEAVRGSDVRIVEGV
jgi:hypothetical protein